MTRSTSTSAGGNALARLRERLARVYEGRPAPIPADRALADVVAASPCRAPLPEALLEGFAWDAEGRRYDDMAACTPIRRGSPARWA